jgi:thiol:disulfide interchange protein DsbG
MTAMNAAAVVSGISLLLAIGAQARPAPPPPPALAMPLAQGLAVHRSFPGPSGLTGWVLLKDGRDPVVVFTTADGRTLLAGAALDAKGRNLVHRYVERYAPKTDYAAFVQKLAGASAIVQGDPAAQRVIYAFFDPGCVHCNAAYSALGRQLQAETHVRWVPLAFLTPRSAGQAATLMTHPDPSAAMARHEESFRQGGVAPSEVTADVKKKLDEHQQLFSAMGFKAVPTLLYRTADGRWDAMTGAPSAAEAGKLFEAPRR